TGNSRPNFRRNPRPNPQPNLRRNSRLPSRRRRKKRRTNDPNPPPNLRRNLRPNPQPNLRRNLRFCGAGRRKKCWRDDASAADFLAYLPVGRLSPRDLTNRSRRRIRPPPRARARRGRAAGPPPEPVEGVVSPPTGPLEPRPGLRARLGVGPERGRSRPRDPIEPLREPADRGQPAVLLPHDRGPVRT